MAMQFRPSEDLNERLKVQAKAEGSSVQNLLAKAAEEYLMRHDKRRRINEALDVILVESADAIRRLGE